MLGGAPTAHDVLPVKLPGNRAQGAVGPNRPCSFKWAASQEKLQPLLGVFFLDFPFLQN